MQFKMLPTILKSPEYCQRRQPLADTWPDLAIENKNLQNSIFFKYAGVCIRDTKSVKL